MAFELHRNHFPGIAASVINAGQVVALAPGDTQRTVVPVATQLPISAASSVPLGIALATSASPGNAVSILDALNVVKVSAAASIGAGAPVGLASSNGGFGPITASGSWVVGQSVTAAAAGEVFSVYVNPRPITF